jgi:hypothetical protein
MNSFLDSNAPPQSFLPRLKLFDIDGMLDLLLFQSNWFLD